MKSFRKTLLAAAVALTILFSASPAAEAAFSFGDIDPAVTNKYVEGEISVNPLSEADALSLIEEAEKAGAGKFSGDTEVLGAFEAAGSADYSGTLTKIEVGLMDEFSAKITVLHQYDGGFEAIPVTDFESGNSLSFSFNTSYGLGKFVLLASPAPTPSSTPDISSASSEAAAPSAAPSSSPAPAQNALLRVTASILVIIIASSLAVVLVSKRRRR